MKIGVPKEIKNNENRVGLVPGGVRQLVEDGHEVFVECRGRIGTTDTRDEVVDLGHDQRRREEVFTDRLHPCNDPLVVVVPTVHEGDDHGGVQYDHRSPNPVSDR